MRQSGWRIFCRVLREQDSHWRHFTGITVLSVAAAPLMLATPLALEIVIDCYLGGSALPASVAPFVPASLAASPLVLAAGLIVLGAVLAQALGFAKNVLQVYTKENLVLGFRARLFPHLERLSLSYHDDKGASDSTFRVLFDTAVIPSLMVDGMIPLVQALVIVVIMAAIILTLSWKIALVALAVAPVLLLVSWPFGRRLRSQWHEIKELDSSAMSMLQEVFAAVRVIKTFGKEERETERLLDVAKKGMDARVRVTVTQGKFDAWIAILMGIGTAGFLVVGAGQVEAGVLSLGQLVLIAALLFQLYAPLQLIVGQIAGMQSALASAERAMVLLDEAPEVVERPDARGLERAVGRVSFKKVSFAYERGKPVLDRVSFDVEPGMRIGIAGRTGAGKTTLMSLLTRLYDPSWGAIQLDGCDIRDVKVDDLRRQFSVMLQEPVLFKTSIADNIAYGLPGATREQVKAAARLADAHDFIVAQPNGYDTLVGERGMRLSGGERQRISLARAFLKDAPILILDEPTSSVDMRTEATIFDALERLMKDRTTFIIAHRPSTLKSCDRVLVLENGLVIAFDAPDAVGSLDELMLMTASDSRKAVG